MRSLRAAVVLFLLLPAGCSTTGYEKTVAKVEIDKFMKKWYVIAGRFTFLEKGAHNAVEVYSFNAAKDRIDIDFYFNRDSFDGPIKKIPQKAWIQNKETNANWEVSPFWPLKFDYLVIALADDYSWTAIGVPNQKYIWIMAQDWQMSDETLQSIVKKIESVGYATKGIERLPQKW
jgi:apolipoprotein D and lipocalin family protein